MRHLEQCICLLCGILVTAMAGSLSPALVQAAEAQRIWHADHDQNAVPQTTCHFRKSFTVLSPKEGAVLIAADDKYELFINGRRVGSGNSTDQMERYDVSKFLTSGLNLVAVRVTNKTGPTAALAAGIMVKDNRDRERHFVTDDSWVTNTRPLPFWYTTLYNDSRWKAAQVLGPLGSTPPWDNAAPELAAPEEIVASMERSSIIEEEFADSGEPERLFTSERSQVPVTVAAPGSDTRMLPPEMAMNDVPAEIQQTSSGHLAPRFKVKRLVDREVTDSSVAVTLNDSGTHETVATASYEEVVSPAASVMPQEVLHDPCPSCRQPHCSVGNCLIHEVYPESFGAVVRSYTRVQTAYGQSQRLTLFEYDFENDPAKDLASLNRAGQKKLIALFPLLENTGYPLLIEESRFGAAVSQSRKGRVLEYLTEKLGLALADCQVCIQSPRSRGLRGVEAIQIDRMQLKTTGSRDESSSSLPSSGFSSEFDRQGLETR